MAYSGPGSFNPDALPAHAEPNEAAQILAYHRQQHQQQQPSPEPPKPESRSHSLSNGSTSPQPPQSYQNKPPPPIPQTPIPQQPLPSPQSLQQLPPQTYRRHSPSGSSLTSYNANDGRPYNHATPPILRPGSAVPRPSSTTPMRPSETPAPISDPALFALFRVVDKKGTGQLTEEELRAALVNGDFTYFDPHTVRMMIRMFDTDRSGTVGFEEFCRLWSFLIAWRNLFEQFDEDQSGAISLDEYSKALVSFGYHLTPAFVAMMFRIYDKRQSGQMSFDIFVQSCISLRRMTDVFKKYDNDRDGYITLSFEEFLTEILQQR